MCIRDSGDAIRETNERTRPGGPGGGGPGPGGPGGGPGARRIQPALADSRHLNKRVRIGRKETAGTTLISVI
eukprot:10845060-Alexandrium_andersonii.AAC.1